MSDKSNESLGTTFNKIWSAAMISKFADGLAMAAIPLGALLDRVNRRLSMIFVQATRVGIGIALASLIISGQMNLVALMILTFIFGISEVVYDTATQSTIPSLLKGSQLERGNSRLQIADTIMQSFIGIPLGAVIFVSAAYSPFLGLAACYVAAMILISTIPSNSMQPPRAADAPKRAPLKTEIKEGLVYLWQHKVLFRLVMTTGAVGFCYAIGQATLVLFLLDHLKVKEVEYGLVMIPLALGALFGAFLSPKLSARFGRAQTLAISLPLSSFSLLVGGLAPNITWYLIASFVHGLFIAQWNILLMSTYHAMIPNEIFGRIHGTRRTIVWGLMPIGGLVGGFIGRVDITLPLIVGGIAGTLIAASSYQFMKSIRT